MTWIDVLVLVMIVGLIVFEARQETGRALLDTVATIVAVQLSTLYAPMATQWLKWKPLGGTGVSPAAQGLCFLVAWGLGLLLSRWLHSQTRWSMDNFDLVFGTAFGIMIAIAAGHVTTDVGARMAIQKHGHLPSHYANSYMAGELRSFRSYHYVINTFQTYQNGGE